MRRTSARRWGVWVAGVALTVASFAAASSGSAAGAKPAAESLPPGFTDTVVATVNKAVALAATPDGRILVVDQSGKIRVIQNDKLLAKPALDISAKVCNTNSERGMLGIAVDPKFATNGFVYVYYTFKKFPKCKRDITDVPVNRVSRFKMTGNKIKPSSEKILIDNMISFHGNHNAGDVGFGKDGMLYVSVGDGGCDYTGVSGCDPDDAISQRGNSLQGKVLRITPTGGIPADNPFSGAGTARCNQGAIASGLTCQEIDMLGFRNPFRFAFDPNATGTRLFVDDTGESTWEEVDAAASGANYGWNEREGPCAVGSTTDCGPPPPGLTNPTFAYSHEATGCGAITGGAFVPDGIWSGVYDSGYFYGDYVCSKIFLMTPDGAGGWTSTAFATGLGAGSPVAMMFGPNAGTTALYYTNVANGQVRVITRT